MKQISPYIHLSDDIHVEQQTQYHVIYNSFTMKEQRKINIVDIGYSAAYHPIAVQCCRFASFVALCV